MTAPRRPFAAFALPTLLLAAGCGERAQPSPTAPAPAVAPSAPTAAATDAAADTASSAADAIPDAAAAAPARVVVLEDDALRVVDTASGSSQRFGLGSDEKTVLREITRALPGPQTTTDGSGDCTNNTVQLLDSDLVLYFSEGTFAGWYLDKRGTLRTAAGYGVGSTRAELDAVADPVVGDEGLGLEFVAGTIVGGLDSDAPDAKITDLRSGDTCVMG